MAGTLTLKLDETTLGVLDRLAEQTGHSRDWLVSRALEAYATTDTWQIERIEAGLAAADEGRFASPDEVERVRAKFAQPG